MKNFINDKDGFTKSDFEKVVMGFMFMITTIAITYKYITKDMSDMNMIYFSLGIAGLFITRKALAYFNQPNVIPKI